MKLGLIAGGGELPHRVARATRDAGGSIVIGALAGFVDAWVDDYPHATMGMGEIGKLVDYFNAHDVDTVTFAGTVRRPDFKSLKVDWRGAKMLTKAIAAATRGDDALLRVVVEAFESAGFAIVGPETLVGDLLAQVGVLGAVQPNDTHTADIDKAFEIARTMGGLDIGQGAVVCAGLVLAVEAQEGTDAMLARIPDLAVEIRGTPAERRGVLVKAPKPVQERRIDLPTVGLATVEGVARAGLAGIVVEAGGAIIVDADAVKAAADAAGVFVLVRPDPAPSPDAEAGK